MQVAAGPTRLLAPCWVLPAAKAHLQPDCAKHMCCTHRVHPTTSCRCRCCRSAAKAMRDVSGSSTAMSHTHVVHTTTSCCCCCLHSYCSPPPPHTHTDTHKHAHTHPIIAPPPPLQGSLAYLLEDHPWSSTRPRTGLEDTTLLELNINTFTTDLSVPEERRGSVLGVLGECRTPGPTLHTLDPLGPLQA